MTSLFLPQEDISTILSTDMTIPLSPGTVHRTLSSPPFLDLPGAINIRDLGLLPNSPVQPGLIYRSGAIHNTPSSSLAELGLGLILDLRSDRERNAHPTPTIQGMQVLHVPTTQPPSPIDVSAFKHDGGIQGYVNMYIEILAIFTPAISLALRHILTTRTPLMFHCTAGKDRTGVLAALFLGLAGASKRVIAYDYALTRVGVEPSRDVLMAMLKAWNTEWDVGETDGLREYVQVKGEFMEGFLSEVERRHGGFGGWVEEVLGWKVEEVEELRGVLVGDSRYKGDESKGNERGKE